MYMSTLNPFRPGRLHLSPRGSQPRGGDETATHSKAPIAAQNCLSIGLSCIWLVSKNSNLLVLVQMSQRVALMPSEAEAQFTCRLLYNK